MADGTWTKLWEQHASGSDPLAPLRALVETWRARQTQVRHYDRYAREAFKTAADELDALLLTLQGDAPPSESAKPAIVPCEAGGEQWESTAPNVTNMGGSR